jgi:lipopolysaccharide heptosyltransferase II
MNAHILAGWHTAQRILAIRLDNLGDVLVTTPALHAIKESLPGADLTLLASPVGAQAGRLNPDIDDVIAYQSPQMDPWQQLPQDSAREQRLIAMLKERRFDGAVIFTSFRQSSLPAAYICYLADIPLRLAASIDGSGSLLTTRHRHPPGMRHEVERGLDLVGAIGCQTMATDLVLEVPAQARATLHDRLGPSADIRPLIVVHPGCSMPARTYPWQRYAEVVDLLIGQLGATVFITGAAAERELVERVCANVRPEHRHAARGLAGDLRFAELCALIERADLVITNNTGPMHMAAAVGTPVVALFALTNPPEQWGPWHVPHRLLYHEVACRMCYQRACPYQHECLAQISSGMVLEAVGELLGQPLSVEAVAGGVEVGR